MNTRLHHPAWFVLPLALALSACNSSGEPGAGMAFPPPQVSVLTITPQTCLSSVNTSVRPKVRAK